MTIVETIITSEDLLGDCSGATYRDTEDPVLPGDMCHKIELESGGILFFATRHGARRWLSGYD